MKTYVIQLESHNDVISTCDKMAWAKTPRILLVWPNRGGILERVIDLVILKRYSKKLGAKLALVTKKRQIISNADQVGVPVFESVEEAQQRTWLRRRRSVTVKPIKRKDLNSLRVEARRVPSRMGLPKWGRTVVFIIGSGAVLTLALFFIPGATVTLAMAEKRQDIALSIWANPKINAPNISGGLPAYNTSVVVEGQNQIASTGSVMLPDKPAVCGVQLTNLTDQQVNIPNGTIVLTLDEPPIRFQISEGVVVPSGLGESVFVTVQAVQAGSTGNVEAGMIQAIEGSVGLSLSVNNPESGEGGSDRISSSPTEEDYSRLREQLLKTLQKTALMELENSLVVDQKLIPATLKMTSKLTETREPDIGLPGERLKLTLQVEYGAWYFATDDVKSVAVTALDAVSPQGYIVLPDTIVITTLQDPILQGDRAHWQVHAERSITSVWSQDALISDLVGKQPSKASQLLSDSLDLTEPPDIVLNPSWWQRLPFLPFRIRVVAR